MREVTTSPNSVRRTFIRVSEAALALGTTSGAIYEQIRTHTFPFRYRRAGRSIWISAHDLELIPPKSEAEPPNTPQGSSAIPLLRD